MIDIDARQGRDFAPERGDAKVNVFESVVAHINGLQSARKKVVVALWSEGSRDRMASMLKDHKLLNTTSVNSWRAVQATPRNETMLAVVGLESGFETDAIAVITEQDILGDRLVRPRKASRKLENFISKSPAVDRRHCRSCRARHRPVRGLQTLQVGGAPTTVSNCTTPTTRSCFCRSRTSNCSRATAPTRPMSNWTSWAAADGRRARPLKNRIREIAGELIKIAAERHIHEAPKFPIHQGTYDEFCARFPYEETEDQLGAITSTLHDLDAGKPMDRLICGDVGFGKTEVALRAALPRLAMDGKQVAVVVPTTLLARQHTKTFTERFKGFPVNVAQASRLVAPKQMTQVKKDLADGQIDIIVGTHALLGKSIKFRTSVC